MPTTVIKKVDPTGSGDYTTLKDWELDRRGNIVTRDTIEIAEVYGGGNVNGVRIKAANGWVTDATHYPQIRAASGNGHGGKFRTTGAYIVPDAGSPGDGGFALHADVGYARFGPGLTVDLQGLGSFAYFEAPYIGDIAPGQPCIFDGLIIRCSFGAAYLLGIQSLQQTEVTVRNCAFLYDTLASVYFAAGVWGNGAGALGGRGAMTVYNCSFHVKNTSGLFNACCIGADGGVIIAASVVSENNYLSVAAGSAVCYGPHTTPGVHDATSNGEATDLSLRNIAYSTANFVNVTEGLQDLHLQSGSVLRGKGADLTSQGVTKDYEGQNRYLPFDVGADQYYPPGIAMPFMASL
jgi:hypothetical protein